MKKIKFHKKPKHRDVKNVRRLQKKMLFSLLDLGNTDIEIDPDMSVQDYLMKRLSDDPERLAELHDNLSDFNDTATIMLSARLTPDEIEELDEDEYWRILECSKKALGGKTAEDFLCRYVEGSLPVQNARKQKG